MILEAILVIAIMFFAIFAGLHIIDPVFAAKYRTWCWKQLKTSFLWLAGTTASLLKKSADRYPRTTGAVFLGIVTLLVILL